MEGKFDKAMGGMKQSLGNAVGNERMQADGAAQSAKGEAKSVAQKAGQKMEDTKKSMMDQKNNLMNSGDVQ